MTLPDQSLDFADWRALLALHTHRHFTRAAESLGISQPALTKRIRQMERRFGGPLFDRHRAGVTPTPAGRLLCDRALQLLEEAARAERMTREALAGDSGVLRIGAGLSVLLSGLPAALRVFRRQNPGVQVSVRDLSTRDQIEALRQGDLDVGFLRIGVPVTDLHVTPVLRDELKIACPEDLARSRRFTPALLFQQPLVLVSRATSPTFHDHVLATCRQAGYAPSIVQEANQLLTALLLVRAGAGLSLVPASCGALGLTGVRLLEGHLPQAPWKIGLACPRARQTAPVIQRFRAIVKSHLR